MRKWIVYLFILILTCCVIFQACYDNKANERIGSRIRRLALAIDFIKKNMDVKPDFEKMRLATVEIKIGRPGGAGTIMAVDNDYLYVLTSRHIVNLKGKVDIKVTDTENKSTIIRNISRKNVFVDKTVDMALIKIPRPKEREFTYFSLATTTPSKGSKIYTIGHPVGTKYTINEGIVSNYAFKAYNNQEADYMLISAPSFWGNSGGAVVNCNTELVGIVAGVVYIGKKPGHYKNLYLYHMTFAVKLDDIHRFLNEII